MISNPKVFALVNSSNVVKFSKKPLDPDSGIYQKNSRKNLVYTLVALLLYGSRPKSKLMLFPLEVCFWHYFIEKNVVRPMSMTLRGILI